ncbi:co-regulatory protein PtrA N-terminal domain-containing protein, partial [Klebsiella pneumoniae]
MKSLKVFFAVTILTMSSLAMAEGGGDRVYGRMMQENQKAMEQYALENGKTTPEVVHYEYGMNLDVQKVISTTQANKTCGV